jgi:hypothetical protein
MTERRVTRLSDRSEAFKILQKTGGPAPESTAKPLTPP